MVINDEMKVKSKMERVIRLYHYEIGINHNGNVEEAFK